MLDVVPPFAPRVLDLIAGELERPFHLEIRHPPVAAVDVLVVAAIFEEDPDGPGLVLADQRGIDIPPAQPHIGANAAEDPLEGVGTLPRRGEGADRPAAGPTNRPVGPALRQFDRPAIFGLLLFDLGQHLFEQEPHVVISQPVVFETAVEPVERLLGIVGLHPAMHDEHPNRHRHVAAGDQLVEHLRRVVLDAILVDVNAGGLCRVVLPGDVNPIIAVSAREDLAIAERPLQDFPLRRGILGPDHAGLETGQQTDTDRQPAPAAGQFHRTDSRVVSAKGG